MLMFTVLINSVKRKETSIYVGDDEADQATVGVSMKPKERIQIIHGLMQLTVTGEEIE